MKYTKEQILLAVQQNKSMASTLRFLNIPVNGGNHRTLTKYINYYKIDITHFTGKGWSKGKTIESSKIIENASKKKMILHEDMFCQNSKVVSSTLRRRVIKNNLIEYKCSVCNNNGIWQNTKLILQLDHINGVCNDNRIENLRFLCPNCHQQTDTWGNKNR